GGKPFNRPTHVALCPKTGDIYVSDGYGNSRVHKYDPKGRHLHSWGEPGTDPGCFNVPHNVVTDAAGLVYVADRENHRVQIFDGKGRYQMQLNNLHRPCGLFAERRNGGLLYVGELPTHLAVNAQVPNLGSRVSVLTLKGDLAARIGGPFAGEDEELQLACLVHDVGRYAVDQSLVSDSTEPMPAGPRARGHHEVGAELIAPWVPERVAWCVRMHADAKRYLCATEPDYCGWL